MLGGDPDYQGGGIGTALTQFALERLKDAGMAVAMVEMGGDPGHAAARRTYEKAGCTLLPIARHFKNPWPKEPSAGCQPARVGPSAPALGRRHLPFWARRAASVVRLPTRALVP